jgi:hypothetical protein
MCADGIAAPLWSVTVPDRVAVDRCAATGTARRKTNKHVTASNMLNALLDHPPESAGRQTNRRCSNPVFIANYLHVEVPVRSTSPSIDLRALFSVVEFCEMLLFLKGVFPGETS